ncbi:hypothetical protein COO60DRAFT_1699945 [Scenedesmus sp. NREL 46B-D3]|nr:hypothetical protein COO60DRAFT_1699945 [Scenedesmus sp. NREL 46B-D3]
MPSLVQRADPGQCWRACLQAPDGFDDMRHTWDSKAAHDALVVLGRREGWGSTTRSWVAAHGPSSASYGGAVFTMHGKKHLLLNALDLKFFKHVYDARMKAALRVTQMPGSGDAAPGVSLLLRLLNAVVTPSPAAATTWVVGSSAGFGQINAGRLAGAPYRPPMFLQPEVTPVSEQQLQAAQSAAAEAAPARVKAAAAAPASAAADDDDDEGLCVCCLDAPSTVVFMHGSLGHLCMCSSCLGGFDWRSAGCPMCREPVEDVVHVPLYVPPNEPRLLRALQQQVDYLGISAPSIPAASSLDSREVVLIPSYWYLGLNNELDPNVDMLEAGCLMYSSSSRGWANLTGKGDPRPYDVRGETLHPHSGGGCWLASVLRAESTGAGEDLVAMVPNKTYSSQRYGDSAALLRASLSSGRMSMPPVHRRMGFSDSAMAAAQGKLYLLGGSCHLELAPFTPLEVYDPHLDCWFSAASPIPGPVSLSEHALVANQQEGLLLLLGGCLTSGNRRHRHTRVFDQVAMYDVNAGKWSFDPSGCKWPGAATSYSIAAAADRYTIMALSLDRASGREVRTDLLDLRSWRWRSGASMLQRQPGGSADDDACLLNLGVVLHEGQVLAVGGRHYWKDGEWATSRVHAYDMKADAWGELPPLPFPICHASPVTVRVPSVLC